MKERIFFLAIALIAISFIINSIYALLTQRTNYTFKLYMTVNFIMLAFMSFSVNLSEEIATPLALVLAIIGLLLEISFLILIRALRKYLSTESITML